MAKEPTTAERIKAAMARDQDRGAFGLPPLLQPPATATAG
jgi:hypothetical protein